MNMRTLSYEEFEESFRQYIVKNHAPFEYMGFIYKNKRKKSIQKIAITLDLCIDTVRQALQCRADILYAFHAPEKLDTGEKNFKKIRKIIQNKLSIYRCHLPMNFAPGVGIHAELCNILKFPAKPLYFRWEGGPIKGGVYRIQGGYTLKDIIKRINFLKTPCIRIPYQREGSKMYKKILISSGSGFKKELFDQVPCDMIISGEAKHSAIVKARDSNITLLEIGHYFSENEPLKIISRKFEKFLGIPVEYITFSPKESLYDFRSR